MQKEREFQRRSNHGGGQNYGQSHGPRNYQGRDNNPQRENSSSRENTPRDSSPRDNSPRENSSSRDGGHNREGGQARGFQRDSSSRQNHPYQNSASRYNNHNNSSRVRAMETIDDIKADISRIEKEIELEIKEIKSMRLGL